MGHVVIREKYIGYTARDEIVRVEAYGKDRIRVRSTRNGSFSEESWTLLPPLSDECTVTGLFQQKGLLLRTGTLQHQNLHAIPVLVIGLRIPME